MNAVDRRAPAASALLERELGLVRPAIEMVASGGSPRVVVAGISLGELLRSPRAAWQPRPGSGCCPAASRPPRSDLSVEAIRR